MYILNQLFNDESGSVQSTEYILMVTILAIGILVGLTTYRDQMVTEFADIGSALESVDQSFVFGVPNADYDGTQVFSTAGGDVQAGFDVMRFNDSSVLPAAPTFGAPVANSESLNMGGSDGDSNN